MRSISHAHGIYGQLKRLGIGYGRFDDLMLILEETLCKHPEAFPVVPGTKVSLCRTNEFVGMSFPSIPSLAVFFYYDDQYVHLISVEKSEGESYGL